MNNQYFTHDEILSQAQAWPEALDVVSAARLPSAADYEEVIFTGCGSAYYSSLSAAAVYQELTGRTARAIPAGELLLNPQVVLPPAGASRLLVAISRSGTTTETLKAAQQFKAQRRGELVVISTAGAALLPLADVPLLLPGAAERSIAQTRSFTCMFLAATAFCARMAVRLDLLEAMSRLPEAGSRLLQDGERAAQRFGEDLSLDRFYFLGSGIRYGLACEANLKMKEMTLTHSEAFHFLEFRHGPMSMVGPGAALVGLISEQNAEHELAVIDQMKNLGGTALTLAESHADVSLGSGVPESIRAVLYLPFLQLMAFHRSRAKGLNPDRPRNLTAAVHLAL